jgi:hypothetical protein
MNSDVFQDVANRLIADSPSSALSAQAQANTQPTAAANMPSIPKKPRMVVPPQTVVEHFGRHVGWGSFPPATTNIAVNATRKQTVAYVIQTYCLPAIVFLRYQLTSIPHSPQNLHQRPSRCCHASLHREVDLVAHGFR